MPLHHRARVVEEPFPVPRSRGSAAPAERNQAGEREALLDAARADAESIRDQARQAGYGEGMAEARRELAERLERCGRLLESLERERVRFLAAVEPQVVELALEVARRVLDDQVRMDSTVVERLVRRGLDRVGRQTSVVVRVHPGDLEAIRALASDGVRLEGDEAVEPGGCILETSGSTLDLSPASQLQEMRRELLDEPLELAS